MAYSNDLRERVVAAVEAGAHTLREIAQLFRVSESTIDKWLARARATGSAAALPWAGGKRPVLAPYEDFIRTALAHQPDLELAELCAKVQATHGVATSPSMMWWALKRWGISRKKKSRHDQRRDTPVVQAARATYEAQTEAFFQTALARLKFLDESGVQLNMGRPYGWSATGTRVVGSTAQAASTRYTIVATLSETGVEAPWLFEGAMTGLAFRTYVAEVLGPTLTPGDIVILDNLTAHKDAPAQMLIEACGAHVVFLPPYSPDFNPIELCWAKLKRQLRTAGANTWAALVAVVREALAAILPEQAEAWFAHCGYDAA